MPSFTVSSILANLIFSGIGLIVFRFAKRDANHKALVIGIILMVYPYFVDRDFLLWGIGIGLSLYAKHVLQNGE